MIYTSGTTGKPKGVCLTHDALIAAARGGVEFDRLTPDEDVLSYLPMAWIGDHLFSYCEALVAGFTINCPESGDTVMTDLREIGPTFYFAPPRVFENLLTQVMIRMEDAGALKRAAFHYFMDVARRCGAEILDGKPGIPLADRLLYALGNVLVYGPLRNVLGMSRIRVAYTAGAAIGPDLFRFYRSIGINMKQLYGATETCAYVCLQPDGDIKLDSVGKPAPGVEVKIADNGEVLVRSAAMLKEYYKRPDATAEVDRQRRLLPHRATPGSSTPTATSRSSIAPRTSESSPTARCSRPTTSRTSSSSSPTSRRRSRSDTGATRSARSSTSTCRRSATGPSGAASRIRATPTSPRREEVCDLIQECVEKVNAELARDPVLCHSQVRRFLVLHKELDPDDDELTRTRKVRRGFIAEKYAVLIEALYAGRKSISSSRRR